VSRINNTADNEKTLCYPAEFGRSSSDGTSVIKYIRLNNLTARVPPFKALKVIGTDTDRSATYDFLFLLFPTPCI